MKYTGSCSPFEGSESVITQVRESGAACSCIWSASLYRVLLGVVDTSHSGEPHMGPTWDQSGLEVGRVDRIWVETGIKVGPIWVADLSLSDLKGCVLVEMSRDFGGLGPQQRCGRSLGRLYSLGLRGRNRWVRTWFGDRSDKPRDLGPSSPGLGFESPRAQAHFGGQGGRAC